MGPCQVLDRHHPAQDSKLSPNLGESVSKEKGIYSLKVQGILCTISGHG